MTGALGIDTGNYSIAYLASWSQGADLATVQATAALIDRRIEEAVLPCDCTPQVTDRRAVA